MFTLVSAVLSSGMDTTVFVTIAVNVSIAVGLMLLFILSVFKLSKTVREITLVWLVEVAFKKSLQQFFEPPKSRLLEALKSSKSTKDERRDRGELVVLEIGVGSGQNFKYYPPGTKLICVDPNRHFKTYFEDNKKNFPNVEIQQFVYSGAEDIDEVGDESVDVVVSTHVLCSVDDMDKVISQVKRVLAKGGKYYYADHVRASEKLLFWIQLIMEPVWKLMADNCHLTRDVERAIDKAGFSEVVQETKSLPKAPCYIKYHTLGVATK